MLDTLQYDISLPVSWRAAPRTFVSLMTLYESNYIRLRHLVDWTQVRHQCLSAPKDDCPLRLTVEERGRYTTTFTLTYLFDASDRCPDKATGPDLQVRVYHDARLAEALRSARMHRHPVLVALCRRVSSELDDRWQRNMMLNKWLDYCESRGHRFDSASAVDHA